MRRLFEQLIIVTVIFGVTVAMLYGCAVAVPHLLGITR